MLVAKNTPQRRRREELRKARSDARKFGYQRLTIFCLSICAALLVSTLIATLNGKFSSIVYVLYVVVVCGVLLIGARHYIHVAYGIRGTKWK